MSEFYRTRRVKSARKARTCEECGHPIEVGSAYVYNSCLVEGEFYVLCAHNECQAWANAVMSCDDGRGFLRDSDPSDEYELRESVLENPPSDLVRSRLPVSWLKAVDEILTSNPAPAERLL